MINLLYILSKRILFLSLHQLTNNVLFHTKTWGVTPSMMTDNMGFRPKNDNSVKLVTSPSVGVRSQLTNLKTTLARSQSSINNLVSALSARMFISAVSAPRCIQIPSPCSRQMFLHHCFSLWGTRTTIVHFQDDVVDFHLSK